MAYCMSYHTESNTAFNTFFACIPWSIFILYDGHSFDFRGRAFERWNVNRKCLLDMDCFQNEGQERQDNSRPKS